MSKLKSLFKGEISKKTLTRYYLPALILQFLLFLLIAYLLYPSQYTYIWTHSMISRLGWPDENVVGFIFFSIGFTLLGFFLLPTVPYAYKRLKDINKPVALVIFILMSFYSLALFFIGMIPNYPISIFMLIHGINAVLIFGGFYISCCLFTFLIIMGIITNNLNKEGYSMNAFFIYVAIFIFGFISTILLLINLPGGLSGHYPPDFSLPFYASPPFYEWLAFMSILALIYLESWILPEE